MARGFATASAPRLATFVAALAGAALGIGASGCVSSTPGLEEGVYRSGPVAFRVGSVPSAWTSITVTAASLAWRDDAREASILLNARCTNRDDATPIRALAEHLVLGTTERNWTNVETIPFDGREAIHGRLTAKLDGVQMGYDLYVLRKDGCIYDFVLVAPPANVEADVAPFEQFAQSFHTLRGSGAL